MRSSYQPILAAAAVFFSSALAVNAFAQSRSEIVVPGTGVQLKQVGDDFEDEDWGYVPNNPKSTEDIDENQRMPMGKTHNGRWYEGAK
ncbi:MAG: hypothetical protein ACK52S_12955, partial [Pirellula sp.]